MPSGALILLGKCTTSVARIPSSLSPSAAACCASECSDMIFNSQSLGKVESRSTSTPVKLWTDTLIQGEREREETLKRGEKEGRGGRMHLSRLWTDTPEQRESEGGRDDKVAQLSKGARFLGKIGP